MICISALICGLSFQMYKPPGTTKRTKKKPDSKVREHLVEFAMGIKDSANKLEVLLLSWKSSHGCDVADRLAALNLNADVHTNVMANLQNSHIVAVKDLQTVLKSKVKFLDGFLV